MNYAEYLTTDYWKAVSHEVKSRAGFRCQVCNAMDRLQAHHRTYAHKGDEMNHLGDLICICARCHDTFHAPKVINGKLRATRMPDVKPKPQQKRQSKAERRAAKRNRKIFRNLEREMAKAASRAIEDSRMDEVRALYDHAADMPKSFPFVIDSAFMRTLRTKAGGYTSKTIKALGLTIPTEAGWPSRLIGTSLTETQCRDALVGRETVKTLVTLERRAVGVCSRH